MSTSFSADGLPVLIGSIPYEDHGEALDLILRYTPEIPLWPQLPHLEAEKMLIQFLEGFPGVEERGGKPRIDTTSADFQEGLLAFFEDYLASEEDPVPALDGRFQVSQRCARGLYLLVERAAGLDCRAVKGQITGPFTLLVGITDQDDRLAYYDPTLREMVVKGMARKAAWQVGMLRRTGKPAILFLDEPALAGLGSSAYISISRDDIRSDLAEVIGAVHRAGGLAGIHVCANTDWNLVLDLELDIVNFDAHGYFDRFASATGAVSAFLDRGGIIAWGGVPTANAKVIDQEDEDSLTALWKEHAAMLGGRRDGSALLRQFLITPSCGTGSLDRQHAERVLALTAGVAHRLRREYGLA